MRRAFARLADRWLDRVLASHRVIVAVAIALTVLSIALASRLQIDSDLRALLPKDHPVVESLAGLERSFGVIDDLRVLVVGGTQEQRHAYVEALVPELAACPDLVDVDHRLRSDFFVEHALYFLTNAEFEELQEHVLAWQHYEFCTAAPDSCIDPPDPKAPERLRALIEARQAQAVRRTGFEDYYERDGVDAQVVLATPTRPSSESDFAVRLVDEARQITAAVRARPGPWAGTDLEVRIAGRYVSQAAGNAAIRGDVGRSGVAGAIGVLLVLFLVFRSTRAVLTLLVPLVCGVAWSMGLTWALLGRLNLITALITTVLMGIGIDAGIHLLGRVRQEIAEAPVDEAIRRAFRGLIVPLLVAASTTIGAFAVMATSDFPAFREFGLIAGLGLVLCLLAMLTVFPALLRLVGVKAPPPGRAPGRTRRWAKALLRRPGALFAVTVILTLAAFQGVRKVQFEQNARALLAADDRASLERDLEITRRIFGDELGAGYLLVDDLATARRVLDEARPRHAARLQTGESTVSRLVGPTDLLPPPSVDQAARRQAIEELAEALPERALARMEAPEAGTPDELMTARDARLLQKMLAAEPFGIDDLPPRLLGKVRAPDGRYIVLAYMNFDGGNIADGVRFIEETRAYSGDVGSVFVGETTVYAAIYQLMSAESPVILGMAVFLVVALVLWQLRSITLTVMTLLPLGLALWWMCATMGLAGLRFTLLNVPILPAILGLGVDNGVYLIDRLRRAHSVEGLAASVSETGSAILAATATTMVGFAAFLVAHTGGLRGIGQVAVIGIATAALAAIIVLPTISALQVRRRTHRRRRLRRLSRGGGTIPPTTRAPP
ncbi:MAG: MMPL family transporter [Nannocystaceae bacterium]